MLPIVLLYALAGAIAIGGSAGGKILYDEAESKRRLRQEIKKLQDIEALLGANINLASAKEIAKQHGIDVVEVEEGYKAFKSGQLSVNELAKILEV